MDLPWLSGAVFISSELLVYGHACQGKVTLMAWTEHGYNQKKTLYLVKSKAEKKSVTMMKNSLTGKHEFFCVVSASAVYRVRLFESFESVSLFQRKQPVIDYRQLDDLRILILLPTQIVIID